jgi:hypothetical protein
MLGAAAGEGAAKSSLILSCVFTPALNFRKEAPETKWKQFLLFAFRGTDRRREKYGVAFG